MSELRDYLKDNKITQREFASRLGVSHEYLSRIVNGHDAPSTILSKLIAHETDGTVLFEAGK